MSISRSVRESPSSSACASALMNVVPRLPAPGLDDGHEVAVERLAGGDGPFSFLHGDHRFEHPGARVRPVLEAAAVFRRHPQHLGYYYHR